MNFLAKVVDKLLYRVAEHLAIRTEEAIEKANLEGKIAQDAKSLFFDPLFSFSGDYTERPSKISFNTLKRMAYKNPIVSAIINTRVNQVASFAFQADIMEKTQNKAMGFKVVHKTKPLKSMTKGEIKFAQELEDYISNCGYTPPINEHGQKRDKFINFLKKIVRDTLIFDQVNSELVLNRAKKPAEFWAVDPATIRIATPEDRKHGVVYVQVINGSIKNTYSYDELIFAVRNPVTDIYNSGYGFSELEQLIHIVAATLFADRYNMSFFSQGLGIQGILNIKTDEKIPKDLLEAFRREFQAMTTGIRNAWKTPVVNAKDLQWINLKPSNKDMEYSKWVEYLVRVTTAVFQISPDEINFTTYGTSGSPMFESNPEAKIKYSKDKGLIPLLNFIANLITEEIVEKWDSNFMFMFVGLDSKTEKDVVELRSREVTSYKTIDEVRVEAGLEPLGAEKGGDMIMSPTYVQIKTVAMQSGNMMSMLGGTAAPTTETTPEEQEVAEETTPEAEEQSV